MQSELFPNFNRGQTGLELKMKYGIQIVISRHIKQHFTFFHE